MRASVGLAFPSITAGLEGRTTWMYRDVEGYVTTGAGNKIDPVGDALSLPWEISGQPADEEQIVSGWRAVKAMSRGLVARMYASATPLRLTDDAVDDLVRDTMIWVDHSLANRFLMWETLPADAQLGTLLLAWADGASGVEHNFPKFDAALIGGDFATCAIESHLDETGNPGLKPRNILTQKLFLAAQRAVDQDLDLSILHYQDVAPG